MTDSLQSYIKFRAMLERNKMGYEFKAINNEGELACEISFGFLGTNYKTEGWVVVVNKNDKSTWELQQSTYDYAITALERHEKAMAINPNYLNEFNIKK